MSRESVRRRLTKRHETCVWLQLHERLLAELRGAGLPDLSAALVDSTRGVPSKGSTRGPAGRPSRTRLTHHLINDAHGNPLAGTLTGGHSGLGAVR